MSTWRSMARIFYRPSEVFAAQLEKRTWGRVLLVLVGISIANTLLGAGAIGLLGTISIVSVLSFVLTLLCLVQAVYLRLVSVTLGIGLKLDRWLALVVWSMVPGTVFNLLASVALVITILVTSELLGREPNILWLILDGTTFSYPSLGFFLDYRYVAEIWTITLQTIGFRQWSGKSILASFAIVTVPFILIRIFIWWLPN